MATKSVLPADNRLSSFDFAPPAHLYRAVFSGQVKTGALSFDSGWPNIENDYDETHL